MKAPQGPDRIKFLVDRKFGVRRRSGGAVTFVSADQLALKTPGLAEKISAYKLHLFGLQSEELQALVDIETQNFNEEERTEAERQDQKWFFNQPHATADFAHWSKAAHWTLDEAVALSFGKAPEVVNWEKVQPYLNVSAFAVQYGRVRDLALRAVRWEQLFDPVLPGFFVAWAKRIDLPFPPDLEAALLARGVQVADWKSLYDDLERQLKASRKSEKDLTEAMGSALKVIDELKFRYDKVMVANEEMAEALRETIEARDAAEALAAELESKLKANLPTEKPISPRERESLLKLIIGMAIAGYTYDPRISRNTATAEIASDLDRLGIGLDVDTVRKWLKEAAGTLPGNKTE